MSQINLAVPAVRTTEVAAGIIAARVQVARKRMGQTSWQASVAQQISWTNSTLRKDRLSAGLATVRWEFTPAQESGSLVRIRDSVKLWVA